MAFEYTITYANIPFLEDSSRLVRIDFPHKEQEVPDQLPPRKHQPNEDLIDELNRLIPFMYLQDFAEPHNYPSRKLDAMAVQWPNGPQPQPSIRINDWYYPVGASRWSVFRGLATSKMVKKMLEATSGNTAQTFKMLVNPCSPENPNNKIVDYTVETQMFMLPPRPLAEHGGQFDGLYLVTLVDERYYFQYNPQSLRVTQDTTWANLISQLATTLGITISYTSIPTVYGQPEPDSQLWTNLEPAPFLLDSLAYNIGCNVVRNLDGTYNLQTHLEAKAVVDANRGNVNKVVRTAGGDMFASGGKLPVGNLAASKNSVLPNQVNVAFPKYVIGNDPVPHFFNDRYRNQRPSCWYEDSYGGIFTVNVPIASGGSLVSGLVGMSGVSGNVHALHDTAKALISGEVQTTPLNNSGLTSLALQLAQNYWNSQVVSALDEVYPGTVLWAPEGVNDIVWTVSTRARQGVTRVFRSEWNQVIREFQHTAVALSGSTTVVAGVGGPSVAQTWRNAFPVSGAFSITANLMDNLVSGGTSTTFESVANLPTQNRWKGLIDNEKILFEGTSGGGAGPGLTVNIANRAIDGTIQASHNSGATIYWLASEGTYGVNLVTPEKMLFAHPGIWSSGGVQEIRIIPQLQTVQALTNTAQLINGIPHYSGILFTYNWTNNVFTSGESVFIIERNSGTIISGRYYGGQFAGYSDDVFNGQAYPLYLTTVGFTDGYSLSGGVILADGSVCMAGNWNYCRTSGTVIGVRDSITYRVFCSGQKIDPIGTGVVSGRINPASGSSFAYGTRDYWTADLSGHCLIFNGHRSTAETAGSGNVSGMSCYMAEPRVNAGAVVQNVEIYNIDESFVVAPPGVVDPVNITAYKAPNLGNPGTTNSRVLHSTPQSGSTNNFCVDQEGNERNRWGGSHEYLPMNLTLANGANNNVILSGGGLWYRVVGPTAVFSITGIASGIPGKLIKVTNTTALDGTVINEGAGSAAANRINTPTSGDVTFGTGQFELIYDSGLSRWVMM